MSTPLFIFWQGGGAAVAEPAPEIVRELTDISQAFAADTSPIRLLPHEWRRLKRIRHIARRDEKVALSALRLFKKRATAARAQLRMRAR